MCCEPTKTASARGQDLAPPRLELGPPAHRVLELGAVRLDAEALAESGADRTAHQHVVREHEVGRKELAERPDVRLDIRAPLLGGEVLEQPRLEPLVAVEHEHRQEPVRQLRPDDARPAQVVAARVALLADDRHVVPGEAPLARQRARVDVRARAAEQIAVPEQNPHV